jgi:hypothetical protein
MLDETPFFRKAFVFLTNLLFLALKELLTPSMCLVACLPMILYLVQKHSQESANSQTCISCSFSYKHKLPKFFAFFFALWQ